MFHLSEVELAATTQQVIADIESLRPDVRGDRLVSPSSACCPEAHSGIGVRSWR